MYTPDCAFNDSCNYLDFICLPLCTQSSAIKLLHQFCVILYPLRVRLKPWELVFGSFSRALLKNISLLSPPIPSPFFFFNFIIVKSDSFLVIPLEGLRLTFYLQEVVTCQWLLHCKFSCYTILVCFPMPLWPSDISVLEQFLLFQRNPSSCSKWGIWFELVIFKLFYIIIPKFQNMDFCCYT